MDNYTAFSHIGGRNDQQDNFLTFSDNYRTCIAVMDGAGGHSNGALASQTVKEVIEASLNEMPHDITPNEIASNLVSIVELANDTLIQMKEKGTTMATTLAMAYIQNDLTFIVWVGDSKVYLRRNNKLFCLTVDHSQVSEFVIKRMISKGDVQSHPQKNILTRAIGARNAEPDGICFAIQEDDELLLTSDGVDDVFSESDIESILSKTKESDKAKALVEEAVNVGPKDNITVIHYQHKPDSTQPVNNCYSGQAARLAEVDVKSSDSEHQIDVFGNFGFESSHNLVGNIITIGRDARNQISIPGDPYMNLKHIGLEKDGDGYVVTDLNSFNGCYVKLTEPTRLIPPFELIIGSRRLCISSTQEK